MTAKIAWYEELLALEPNSKLFIPLAQAYILEKRIKDAALVLQKGLSFHPEHLEARLILIQCLARLDDHEAAKRETQRLVNVLADHPIFWNLWAEISKQSANQDTAMTLRLLAKLLSGESINWGNVLEQGLKTMLLAEAGPLQKAEQAQAAGEETLGDGSAPHSEAVSDPLPDASSSEPRSEVSTRDTAVITEEPELDQPESELREASETGTPPATSTQAQEGDKDSDHHKLIQSRIPLPKPEDIPGYEASRISLSPAMRKQPVTAKDEAEMSAPAKATLSEMERNYYETRTYAALLADQGEIQDALELYNRLLRASSDAEQRRDLKNRIRELKEKMQKASPQAGQRPAPETVTHDGREEATPDMPSVSSPQKMVQTLTRLAERLEARSQA
jgi:tetratricopeptide (TPR) repeat protein